ncbi:MAG: ComEA family DNA-binding protein [Candidatus Methylomirabilia bacterium]
MIRNVSLVLLLSLLGVLVALPTWAAQGASPQQSGAVTDGTVNINTASKAELMKLVGIGPVTAERIIRYRDTKGLFERPEDVQKVRGVGNAIWERNRSLIRVK